MAFWGMVFLVLIFLPMTLAAFAWADTVLLSEDVADLRDQGGAVSQSEAAELELRQLKSKISYLETLIEDRTAEVKRTDGGIKQLEKVIEEKSNSLASLQTAEKESLEVREQIGEVNARANELEKQILNLKKEIEAQNRKKDELESQANAAEEKIEELKLKLENLQKINNEQKSRIHKAQRALQAAEEEMLKAKVEASSMTKQLKEVHRAWLPSWLSTHLVHCQSFVLTLWNQIGRPVFNPTIQEALKQKYEVEKWLQHHLETIKRSTIKPHIMNIQETVDPYFQEAKIFLKPYVDQVAEITKPHLDKACLFLKPFSKKVIYYHKKIYKNVQVYHSLAQATVHETLNSYELTKPLATEGLVQFMTSILIVLSVIVLFRTLRWKEPKKRHHSSNRSHTRRRAKRANASK